MNAQEIFDKVATHLIQQGEPALNSGGSCVYRNDQGLKCAVGCLIPDDKYESRFEELGIGSHFNDERQRAITDLWSVLEGEGISQEDTIDLLDDLQTVHDNYFNNGIEFLKSVLRQVADRFDLDPFVLEK